MGSVYLSWFYLRSIRIARGRHSHDRAGWRDQGLRVVLPVMGVLGGQVYPHQGWQAFLLLRVPV